MKGAVAALVLAAGLWPGGALAEKLTIALSTEQIRINSNFTGTALTVFGVIESDANGRVVAGEERKVAVLLLGPRESVVTRRKDRVLGIWVNRAAQTMIGPPAFYAVDTSAPIDQLASRDVLKRLQVGFDNIAFIYEGRPLVNDPGAADFRDAFVRLKQSDSLYQGFQEVSFVGDTVFRSTIQLPANIPVGTYSAVAYVFSGGDLVAHADGRIEVLKTGFEEAMSSFANNQSLVYGLMCALLAIFVGWLGGVIFRRD